MTTYDFLDGAGPVPAHQHSNGGGWVADSTRVVASAYIGPKAKVSGTAWVLHNARVFGNASVFDNAVVYDNAWVFGNARVFDGAKVCGNAVVYGNAKVCGNAKVLGNAVIGMRLDRFDAAIKENTMSDFIAEIRAVAGRISDVDDHVTVHQAADEIERLREALRGAKDSTPMN